MARTKMQMQHMQMRMKLPLKHDIRYLQHFTKMNSERCQASEEELFVKTVNYLKPLKAVITKRSTLGIWWGSEYASTFPKLYIWKGGRFSVFWFIFFYFFNISVKYCFLSFLYLNCCKLFEVFNPRINKAIIIILQ